MLTPFAHRAGAVEAFMAEATPGPIHRSMDAQVDEEQSDGFGWSFPLPDGTEWVAWHTWVDDVTTWVDAQIFHAPTGRRRQLDVGATGDDDGCLTGTQALAAFVLWESGSVLLLDNDGDGMLSLVVGDRAVSRDNIREALARAWREGLLPVPLRDPGFGVSGLRD